MIIRTHHHADKNLNFQMEEGNGDHARRKMEEKTDGKSQNSESGNEKIDEETNGKCQNENGKNKMEEDTDVQFQIEKGEKKMEEKRDGQSQNQESLQGYFCEATFSSQELYTNHVMKDHQNHESLQCYFCEAIFSSLELYIDHVKKEHPGIPRGYRRLRIADGTTTPTLPYLSCPYCLKQFYWLKSSIAEEGLLMHLKELHPTRSWVETSKRSGSEASVAVVDDMLKQKYDPETKSEEDWRAYINYSSDDDDEVKSVADEVVKRRRALRIEEASIDDSKSS